MCANVRSESRAVVATDSFRFIVTVAFAIGWYLLPAEVLEVL